MCCSFLREAARSVDVDPEGMEILPILDSRDPRIEQIGLLLKEEIEAEGLLSGRLYAESLTGGLSRRALKEVIDHISSIICQRQREDMNIPCKRM